MEIVNTRFGYLFLALLSFHWCECRQVAVHVSDSVATYEHTIDCCTRGLQRISSNDVTQVTPPNIKGEWMSSGCEVRPGPEFIIRRYKFHPDDSFMLHQFYYQDNLCTKPTYTLRVRGRISRRPIPEYEVISSTPQGATRSFYELDKIVMVAYDYRASKKLMEGINETCPGFFREGEEMKMYKRYVLLDWTQEYAVIICTEGLAISVHELEVMKQEMHRIYDERTKEFKMRQELFLGDIPTEKSQRIYYEPTAYQTPLVRFHTNDSTSVRIHAADDFNPPIIPSEKTLPNALKGEWVSIRCEVKGSYFMTRHISYYGNQTWDASIKYFVDPHCRRPAFAITSRGIHNVGVVSNVVDGGTEFNFRTEQISIKPLSLASAQTLNSNMQNDCGQPGTWQIDTEQDVTMTNGCKMLGLSLPDTEYQLYRVEYNKEGKLLLYNGQLLTNGQCPSRPELRPTSYDSPLVHCAGLNPVLEPPSSQNVIHLPQYPNSGTSRACHHPVVLIIPFIILLIKRA